MNVKCPLTGSAKDNRTMLFARFVSMSIDVEDQIQVLGLHEWFTT
jgi:hypothetical protein